jgi:hypothetical protein
MILGPIMAHRTTQGQSEIQEVESCSQPALSPWATAAEDFSLIIFGNYSDQPYLSRNFFCISGSDESQPHFDRSIFFAE